MFGRFRSSIFIFYLLCHFDGIAHAQNHVGHGKEGTITSDFVDPSEHNRSRTENDVPTGSCQVNVRLVDAHCNKVKSLQNKNTDAPREKPQAVAEDDLKFVKAFARSLDKMEYNEFHEQPNLVQLVRLGEEAKFRIDVEKQEKHDLYISPLFVKDGIVNFTVTWLDPAGKEVFASRMRVADGKELSLGAEHTRDYSTVVHVEFSCQAR